MRVRYLWQIWPADRRRNYHTPRRSCFSRRRRGRGRGRLRREEGRACSLSRWGDIWRRAWTSRWRGYRRRWRGRSLSCHGGSTADSVVDQNLPLKVWCHHRRCRRRHHRGVLVVVCCCWQKCVNFTPWKKIIIWGHEGIVECSIRAWGHRWSRK